MLLVYKTQLVPPTGLSITVLQSHCKYPPPYLFSTLRARHAMAGPSSSFRTHSSLFGLFTVAVLLIVCAGFSIGLTFAPCYSSLCVEKWFPTQARVHIAAFYGSIAVVAICLAAWSNSKAVRLVSGLHLLDTPLPLLGIRLSVGGVLLSSWILAVTLATTAYWLPAEHAIWYAKGIKADWTQYMFRVTWSGVTGHWCDILFGLVFLPVGRNSLISNAFGVQASALLLAHKFLAYTLCVFGLIHGLLYYVRAMWTRVTPNVPLTDLTPVFPRRLCGQCIERQRV